MHTPETKAAVLALVAKGYTQAEAGRRHGVHSDTVKMWVRLAREAKDAPIESTDLTTIASTPGALIGNLSSMLAETMPRETPEDVYRAGMAQKLLGMLDGANLPPVKSMKDWMSVLSMLNTMLKVGG